MFQAICAFLFELTTMVRLDKHLNLVNLLGTVTKHLAKGRAITALKFSDNILNLFFLFARSI